MQDGDFPIQPTAPSLYPDLSQHQNTQQNELLEPPLSSQQFRLHKINELQKQLEEERDNRASLAKKYQRGINVFSGVSYSLEIGAIGLGTAGITLLSTVIATPIVIGMEGVALGLGGLSVVGNLICDKILAGKARKHYQINVLAQSKLNTISDHISKALNDNEISDEEFTLIISEVEKYYQLRDEIRHKIKTKIDNETKDSLIQQGKQQAVEEFKKNDWGNRRLADARKSGRSKKT